jgi:hypothetical protein
MLDESVQGMAVRREQVNATGAHVQHNWFGEGKERNQSPLACTRARIDDGTFFEHQRALRQLENSHRKAQRVLERARARVASWKTCERSA